MVPESPTRPSGYTVIFPTTFGQDGTSTPQTSLILPAGRNVIEAISKRINKVELLFSILLIVDHMYTHQELKTCRGYITCGKEDHLKIGVIMRLASLSLRNLFRRRLRTALCTAGVALATIIVIAVGATATRYVTIVKEMNLLFGGKLVVVARGVIVIQAFPIGGTILETTVQEIRGLQGVRNAVPMLFVLNTEVSGSIQLLPSNISIGVPPDNWAVLVGDVPLKPGGEWPQNSSDTKAVVGPSLADQNNLSVGSTIRVENSLLEVSGIVETKMSILSRAIIMPLKTAQNLYGYGGLVNMVIVEPEQGFSSEELSSRIEEGIRGVKALEEDERNSLVKPMLDEVEKWNLGITAALMMLAASTVMTFTAMNVAERRREFAILDALGAPRSFAVRLIMLETLVIGSIGSLTGVFLGLVSALIIASSYTSIPVHLFIASISDLLPLPLIAEILLVMVGVSCASGAAVTILSNRTLAAETLRVEH